MNLGSEALLVIDFLPLFFDFDSELDLVLRMFMLLLALWWGCSEGVWDFGFDRLVFWKALVLCKLVGICLKLVCMALCSFSLTGLKAGLQVTSFERLFVWGLGRLYGFLACVYRLHSFFFVTGFRLQGLRIQAGVVICLSYVWQAICLLACLSL